jgi:hypothetical protein
LASRLCSSARRLFQQRVIPLFMAGFRVNTGDVRIRTASKTASVYVDGGFAGTTDKLKKFPLRPGKHTIEVRESDGRSFREKIHVIRGRTVELTVNPQ